MAWAFRRYVEQLHAMHGRLSEIKKFPCSAAEVPCFHFHGQVGDEVLGREFCYAAKLPRKCERCYTRIISLIMLNQTFSKWKLHNIHFLATHLTGILQTAGFLVQVVWLLRLPWRDGGNHTQILVATTFWVCGTW